MSEDKRDLNDMLQDGDEAQAFEILANPEPLTPDPADIAKNQPTPPAAAFLEEALKSWRDGGPKAIKTGITALDKALGGGIYPGFIVLGAIPGLGKTTLALQIADLIAEGKQPDGDYIPRRVLFFSLEMPRADILAKSISRLTGELAAAEMAARPGSELDSEQDRYLSLITSTRYIQAGYRYYAKDPDWNTPEAIEIYNKAVARYRDRIAPYMTIIEAGESFGEYSVQDVKDEFLRQCERPDDPDKKPDPQTGPDLIVIDYLQLLAPPDDRLYTDKQKTDKIVTALARLRREIDKPILVISSMARSSYMETIGLDSMKESGSIEYSAECVLGLSYAAAKNEDEPKTKSEGRRRLQEKGRPWKRSVDLTVLKSRHGKHGDGVPFDFFPAANYYQVTTEAERLKNLPPEEAAQEEATFTDKADPNTKEDVYIALELWKWLERQHAQTARFSDLMAAFNGRGYLSTRLNEVLAKYPTWFYRQGDEETITAIDPDKNGTGDPEDPEDPIKLAEFTP